MMMKVKYWWTEDGDMEICRCEIKKSPEAFRCYHCTQMIEGGSTVYVLHTFKDADMYHLCEPCAKKSTEMVKTVKYREMTEAVVIPDGNIAERIANDYRLDSSEKMEFTNRRTEMKPYRIWKTKRDYVFVVAECPSKALETAGVTGYYYWDIELITGEKIDKMNSAELDELVKAYPIELQEQAEKILQIYGKAYGEAVADWWMEEI